MFCVINGTKRYLKVKDGYLYDKLIGDENMRLNYTEKVYYFNTDAETANVLVLALRGSDMFLPFDINLEKVKSELQRLDVYDSIPAFDKAAKLSKTCTSKDFQEFHARGNSTDSNLPNNELNNELNNESDNESVEVSQNPSNPEHSVYDEKKFGAPVDLKDLSERFAAATEEFNKKQKEEALKVNMEELINQATTMANSIIPLNPALNEMVKGSANFFNSIMSNKSEDKKDVKTETENVSDDESSISSLEDSDDETRNFIYQAQKQLALLASEYGDPFEKVATAVTTDTSEKQENVVEVEGGSDNDSLPDLEYD